MCRETISAQSLNPRPQICYAESNFPSAYLEPLMSFLSRRLARVLRLAIAPLKGFFSSKSETKMPSYDPGRTTFWAHLKEVAKQDSALYLEPFKFAVREFKQERARPY